jgi:hypothetical protein
MFVPDEDEVATDGTFDTAAGALMSWKHPVLKNFVNEYYVLEEMSDGEIDMRKVWFLSLRKMDLPLMMCASVLKRAGIKGIPKLYSDC